ncbi:ABC transporter ATP-binding protein [Spiroplasma diminutum]|uniref:ABC transporter ATP-binding protein/permease n=1 Tax=Spiroplasma diminutum CUAS-1 TaxID=1276221 RepID=S5M116_9MOLU|nr:ABC transporter B family permease/ATP-binding protein [Spiroplasma diminutum]AGR42551.1 ABC transporter ATP-binding protein/permease [Spiroplasma diminutum CUAS-1]
MKAKKISKNTEFFKIVGRYYLKQWKLTILIISMVLLFALTRIMIPMLTQQMTMSIIYEANKILNSNALPPKGFWGLHWNICIYIALAVVLMDIIATFLFNFFGYLMGRKIEVDLRNRILEKLVRQDISYYSDKKIGELLTKVVSDTQVIGEWAVNIPSSIGISISQIFIAVAMTFIFDWKIASAGFTVFLIILIMFVFAYMNTVKKYEKIRLKIEEVNGNVTDRVATVRLIKTTGTEQYEADKFREEHKGYYKLQKPVASGLSWMLTVVFAGEFIISFSASIFAALFYGLGNDPERAKYFFENTFASYMLAQAILIGPLYTLLNSSFGLAMSGVAAIQVTQTLNSKSIMDPHYYDGIEINELKGNIVFKDVEFRYPEKPEKLILPKFNFEFKEGTSYAFVGETGSGKSTIARLLLRFYDPSNGEIIINHNKNLKDIHLSSFLKYVGYVEQEPQILFGDVFENVKYGKFEATDEEVIEACKKAEIHNLIESWPEGYKTILGERGFMLSGGQKQRLVIARMFLKDPQLLILDEATSALDNIVEKEIQAKLNELMKNRTSVTIAHRLSTIKNVDEIIVLGANGKGIVQRGTFDELVNKPGHFKNLYDAGLMSEKN